MKSLLPSLKERKRYVAFGVISQTPVTQSDVANAIVQGMRNFVGDLGLAQAGIQVLSERWNSKTQRGIVRVNHTSTDMVKASFLYRNDKNLIIHSLGTSGMVEKTYKKFVGG